MIRLPTLLSIVCAGLVVQGCDSSPRIADDMHPLLTDPKKRHPITVVADTPTLDVPAWSAGARGETPLQLDVMRFMVRYRQEGRGPLNAWVSSNGEHDRAVAARLRMIRAAAREVGVEPGALRIRSRAADGQRHVTLAYDRIAAEGPACGDWSENIANNRDKLPHANFGCASQRNLAAMAARPTDFIFSAPEVERGAERRSGDYRTFTRAGASSGGASPSTGSAAATTGPGPASSN